MGKVYYHLVCYSAHPSCKLSKIKESYLYAVSESDRGLKKNRLKIQSKHPDENRVKYIPSNTYHKNVF